MKVSELAKKINIGAKDLLVELKGIGSRAASPSAKIEDSAVKEILARRKKESKSAKATAKKAPAAKGAKAPKLVKVRKSAKSKAPVRTASKPVARTVKKAKKVAPPIEVVPPKKTRVLIKKKAVPQPIPEPIVAVDSPPEVEPETIAVLPDQTPAPEKTTDPSVPSPSLPPPASLQEKTAPEAPADKRKLLKTNLFELAKQELSHRLKQRGKKTRKIRRGKENHGRDFSLEGGGWQGGRSRGGGTASMAPGGAAGTAEVTRPRKKAIKLSEGLTVKDFAEQTGLKSVEVIRKLMEMGTMATVNQPMDLSAGTIIAESYGLNVEAVQDLTEEEILAEQASDQGGELLPRPPVVTIMGHVDHGKTSLLDAIRSKKVAEGEAGGITQHIGAYALKIKGRTISFLDTPGHEAFTAMRARGAKVTDIVVLVVAADDGVMPQTVEAINHARAADVPIIVAINKIDKPEANPERVKNALAEHDLLSEAWGGKTIFVEVSAKKSLNLDMLLEMILLQADVLELKADSNRLASGVVIEAKMDKGRGPVATVLVQSGTLKVGDVFVTGTFYGRVRALINDEGDKVQAGLPSYPVEVIGLLGVPQAGDLFTVVREERVARDIAARRRQKQRTAELASRRRVTLEDLYTQIQEGTVKELNLILRADVQGSVEALKESLDKLGTEAVKVNVIHNGVGGITETDVLLASASNAIIIGFNIRPEAKAAAIAEKEKVDIRSYDVIYKAIDDIRAAMEGLLEPTLEEKVIGRCDVRQVFHVSKVGTIAGAYVTEGMMARANTSVRVLRDSVVIYEGVPSSLKRFKDDVREVQAGYECGIGIEKFNDIKAGDVIEAFVVEKIPAKL